MILQTHTRTHRNRVPAVVACSGRRCSPASHETAPSSLFPPLPRLRAFTSCFATTRTTRISRGQKAFNRTRHDPHTNDTRIIQPESARSRATIRVRVSHSLPGNYRTLLCTPPLRHGAIYHTYAIRRVWWGIRAVTGEGKSIGARKTVTRETPAGERRILSGTLTRTKGREGKCAQENKGGKPDDSERRERKIQ